MINQDTNENRQIVAGLLFLVLLGLMIMGLPELMRSLARLFCWICYELERYLMWRFCPDLFGTVNYFTNGQIPWAIGVIY